MKPRLDWARGVSVVVQRKGQCEKCCKHERWSVWCVWKNSHFLPVLWYEGPEEPRPALLSWSGLAGSTLCWVGLLTLLQEHSPRPLRHLLPFTLFGLTSPGSIYVLMLPAFLYHHAHLLCEVFSFFPNSQTPGPLTSFHHDSHSSSLSRRSSHSGLSATAATLGRLLAWTSHRLSFLRSWIVMINNRVVLWKGHYVEGSWVLV